VAGRYKLYARSRAVLWTRGTKALGTDGITIGEGQTATISVPLAVT
jgi:hypothetical protein